MTASINLENAVFATLPNGLRTMICQLPASSLSYVSMTVRAGHFYDPDDCEGLSHLLEHMMFLGSRHMPKPNSINELIEANGGSINAWTGTEYANYHFSCHDDKLSHVLPAFADMLRAPLFDKQCLDKEINAIEAEFEFKRKDDLRRLYQIHKETANPAHPFSKFSVGNAEIFRSISAESLRKRLKAFHQQYYVGSNMGLVVCTSQDPNTVLGWLHQTFAPVKAGEKANTEWPALYNPDQLGVQINIVPLQVAKRMIVTFALPGLHHDFRTKPLNFISHLLGDEGDGSLLAYLKSRRWVTNLIAGSGIEGDDFKDFNVSFQLTEEGLGNRDNILKALFSYLHKIKHSLDETWRYQEKAQLSALAYQYEDNPKLQSIAIEYSQHLFLYSPDEIRQLRVTIDDWDKEKIDTALAYFQPTNIRVKMIAPSLPTDKICRHYGAHYKISPLPVSLIEALSVPPDNPDLLLPPPNPYLDNDYHLTLPETAFVLPVCVLDKPHAKMWFCQDSQFHSPKGDIYISFDTPSFSDDLNAVAAKRLWLAALNDFLQAKYYRAEIAGLHYRIYGHQAGFTLHTRGFSNQQATLAIQLLKTIHAFKPDRAQFDQLKTLQLQSLQNALLNKPTNRLFSRLSVLVQRNTQAPVELLKAVNACSFENMLHYREHALEHYFVESFMHGNWTSDEARDFAVKLEANCPGANGEAIPRSVSKLPVGDPYYHEVTCEHDDAAVVLYLQAPSNSLNDTAMCMVLEQMLAAPFFNILRTEKQLGYIVGTGYVPHNQHPGMAFYIQSPAYGPETLLKEIKTFLFEQLGEIEFYRFYWATIKQNLLKQLEERDLSLSMKSQRLWVSLGTQDHQFNRNAKLASCIEQITFDQIEQYANAMAERVIFGEMVLFAPGRFATLDIPEKRQVFDIGQFKKDTPYFAV